MRLLPLILLASCGANKFDVSMQVSKYILDSRYTLELIPAEIIVHAKVYRNNKLLYQDQIKQKFYLKSNYSVDTSPQWNAQINSAKSVLRERINKFIRNNSSNQ